MNLRASTVFVLSLTLVAPAVAARRISCAEHFPLEPFETLARHLDQRLPKEAARWEALLRSIRPGEGPSQTVLDTEALFPEKLLRPIFDFFPDGSTWVLVPGGDFLEAGDVLGARDKTVLGPEYRHGFHAYVDALERAVNAALGPEESVRVSSADVRLSRAGSSDHAFPQWHQDGEYLAVAVALVGEGTEYWEESPAIGAMTFDHTMARSPRAKPYRRTPRGKSLVFSADDRFRRQRIAATVHRSPPAAGDRMFLLVRFRRK